MSRELFTGRYILDVMPLDLCPGGYVIGLFRGRYCLGLCTESYDLGLYFECYFLEVMSKGYVLGVTFRVTSCGYVLKFIF